MRVREDIEVRARFGYSLREYAQRRQVALRCQNRYAGLDDAGLLTRNRFDGVAKVVGVIERDVGDNGEFGRDDVRRIQAATETDFNDGHFNASFRERKKSNGRRGLEKGWREALNVWP